jgi:hypothetical protein
MKEDQRRESESPWEDLGCAVIQGVDIRARDHFFNVEQQVVSVVPDRSLLEAMNAFYSCRSRLHIVKITMYVSQESIEVRSRIRAELCEIIRDEIGCR